MKQYLLWGIIFTTWGIIRITVQNAITDSHKGPIDLKLWRAPLWIIAWPLLVFKSIDVVCNDIIRKHG